MRLVEQARAVARRAYAPYSKYRVGAAIETATGEVFTGCNVENASYGLTICAERAAIGSAVSAGRTRFRRIAIAALGSKTPYPCGACRQVLAEFGDPEVLVAAGRRVENRRLSELLPTAFSFKKARRTPKNRRKGK